MPIANPTHTMMAMRGSPNVPEVVEVLTTELVFNGVAFPNPKPHFEFDMVSIGGNQLGLGITFSRTKEQNTWADKLMQCKADPFPTKKIPIIANSLRGQASSAVMVK